MGFRGDSVEFHVKYSMEFSCYVDKKVQKLHGVYMEFPGIPVKKNEISQ